MQDKLIPDKTQSTGQLNNINNAIRFLESTGEYKVCKLKKSNSRIITYSEIVEYFYDNLRKVEENDTLLFTNNTKSDFASIKKFVEDSKNLGVTKKLACEKLYSMLEITFKYYNKLSLNKPPSSLSYLLSSSGNWIIKKAVNMYKKEIKDYEFSDEFKEKLEYICSLETKNIVKYKQNRHNKLLDIYNNRIKVEENGKEKK